MYGVSTEEFLKALLRPRVKVGSEWVNKGQNMEQVVWSVGAMVCFDIFKDEKYNKNLVRNIIVHSQSCSLYYTEI